LIDLFVHCITELAGGKFDVLQWCELIIPALMAYEYVRL